MDRTGWYERSRVILHIDHHTSEDMPVGRDADPNETFALLNQLNPDVLQIHAKGNPGWTTYPSKVGYTPPQLARDVLGLWRTIATDMDKPFSAYYNLGRDGEVQKRVPQWNRINAGGKPYEKMLCYQSGVADGYLLPQIQEIMETYHPDGFWFDGSAFTVNPCYCDECVLQWKKDHDIPVPRSVNSLGWDLYLAMQREIYRKFIHMTCQFIHDRDPQCVIAVNVAYTGIMPEKPDPAIGYLTRDVANDIDHLALEATIMDGQEMPCDAMTAVWYRDSEGNMHPKPLPQLTQEAAAVLSRGPRFSAWDNPTDGSGLREETIEQLARVVEWLRERNPWWEGTKNDPDISIVHSARSHYARELKESRCFPPTPAWLRSATNLLDSIHMTYEIIPEWRLCEGNVCGKLVIWEHPATITTEANEALENLLQKGISVLVTGDALFAGGAKVRDMAGIIASTQCNPPSTIAMKISGKGMVNIPWVSHLPMYGVELGQGKATIVCDTQDDSSVPFVVENAVNGSRAMYCTVPIFSILAKADVDQMNAWEAAATEVLQCCLPPAKRSLMAIAPPSVHISKRVKGKRMDVHLVNRNEGSKSGSWLSTKIDNVPSAPDCTVCVRVDGVPEEVLLQPGNRKVDWQCDQGIVEAVVPAFAIHEILEIQ